MTMATQDLLGTQDENDLSGNSAVEVVTADWVIQNIEDEQSETPNGSGRKITIEFESDDWYAPITMRFFTSYTSKLGKNTDWVKRSRGTLKNILKAATGQTNLSEALDSNGQHYLVGRHVLATTKDGGDGFAVLSRFKKVA